ncbi:MAG TPA: S-layer homology domain-containing protein [Chloroflexia bacterium]|nr:S-layer homology domain-containing protein [Chloroflexia bacterium]
MNHYRALRWRAGIAGGVVGLLAAGVIWGSTGPALAAGPAGGFAGAPAVNTPPPTWTAGTPHPTRTPPPDWTPPATRPPMTPLPTRTRPPNWTPVAHTPPPTWTPGTPHPTRTPPPNWTPWPTRTPRPMVLRPYVQFGHARPGEVAAYHEVLLNRFEAPTSVTLFGHSWNQWGVEVQPTQVVAHPGLSTTIGIHVTVPISPMRGLDVERITARTDTGTPYTTTAHLITITRRHPFTDLAPGDWADDPVQFLVDQGIVSGYADGGFHPYEGVTRSQFAKMIVGAQGWTLVSPGQATFNDVPASNWAFPYVETAVAHGVLSGYPDGTFRPGAPLTRAQLTKMLATSHGWTADMAGLPEFTDVGPDDWFASYVGLATSAGTMSGYDDGTFRPYAAATRAQVAKILTLSMFSTPSP